MVSFSEDDEGKTVVDEDGNEVGLVVEVRHGTAYVDPDPGITDRILAKLGWSDRDEDEETHPLKANDVERITEDEVHLRPEA